MANNIFFQPFVGKHYADGGMRGARQVSARVCRRLGQAPLDKMPGERWQDGEPIVVDGCSTATGAYLLNNGRRVKTMAVNHPSVGYSWDYWYRVLEKFFLH